MTILDLVKKLNGTRKDPVKDDIAPKEQNKKSTKETKEPVASIGKEPYKESKTSDPDFGANDFLKFVDGISPGEPIASANLYDSCNQAFPNFSVAWLMNECCRGATVDRGIITLVLYKWMLSDKVKSMKKANPDDVNLAMYQEELEFTKRQISRLEDLEHPSETNADTVKFEKFRHMQCGPSLREFYSATTTKDRKNLLRLAERNMIDRMNLKSEMHHIKPAGRSGSGLGE